MGPESKDLREMVNLASLSSRDELERQEPIGSFVVTVYHDSSHDTKLGVRSLPVQMDDVLEELIGDVKHFVCEGCLFVLEPLDIR